MNNLPKVSIIVPIYNCAPFIGQTLSAILNQKYKNIEVILVNDGSTDNLLNHIETFLKDKRLKYHYQENQGAAAARNKGIENATGKYIAFCDCDDVWVPNRLFKEVQFLEKNPHIGMCSGLAIPCTSDLKPITQTWFVDYGIVNHKLFLHNQIWTSSVVLRNNLLKEKKLFFNKKFKRAQDYHFWLQLSLVTPIFVLRKISYFYRIRPHSITRDPSKRDKDYSNLAVHEIFGFNNVNFRSILFSSKEEFINHKNLQESIIAIHKILNIYKNLKFLTPYKKEIERFWTYILYLFRFCFKVNKDILKPFLKNEYSLFLLGTYFNLLQKMHNKVQKNYLKIYGYFLNRYAIQKSRTD